MFRLCLLLLILTQYSFAQCPPATSTCTPGSAPASSFPFGMGILNVTLGAINNTTPGVQEGYRDYSCTIGATLTQGQSYPISVRTNASANENVRVWLDLNNDGTFNPTTELLFSSNATRLHTGTITLPATAVRNTPLRLRVAADWENSPIPTPCATPQYSQTEDYAVTVVANTQAPAADFVAAQPFTCSGLVQFTDQSQNAPSSWLWNFGDGATSSLQNPQHQYAQPGAYTVSLTATNALGSTVRTRAGYITYDNQVPVAAACTPATTLYCCGYGITQFTLGSLVSSSTDGAAGYEDFTCARRLATPAGSRLSWAVRTGGTNAHDVRAYLDLNDDGQFTASELLFSAPNQRNPSGQVILPVGATVSRPLRLRVIADAVGTGGGSCPNASLGQAEDYTLLITAGTSAPSAQASNSYVVGCDTLVRFTDRSAFAPTSWLWTFGDGTSSTQQNPQHRYAQPGNYRVQLQACNAFGCDTLPVAQVLRINGRRVRPATCMVAIAAPAAQPAYAIREFQLHTITNLTGDASEGYGDFTCTQRAFLSAGGRYPVLVRSPGLLYNFRSRVWIDWNNDGTFTEPQELAFAGNDDTPQHRGLVQVPATALLDVPLRVRVLGAYDGPTLVPCGGNLFYGQVEEYSVVVLPATVPAEPWFTVSQDSVCAATPVAFQLTNQTPPGGSSVTWTFGDGTTSTQLAPTHAYSGAGTYTVRATLCTPAGCRAVSRAVHVTAAYVTTPNTCGSLVGEEGWELLYGVDSVRLHKLRFKNRNFEKLYQDFSCSRNVRLQVGQPYPLLVSGRTVEQRVIRVFLDANNDGTFSAGEVLASGGIGVTTRPLTQTIVMPPTAVLNVPLRLRVVTDSQFTGATPCSIARGQFLDFSVTATNGPLSIQGPKSTATLYVTPTPAADDCVLHHAVPVGETMLLTITSATGQLRHTRRLRSTAAQTVALSIKQLNLSNGLYILRLEAPGYSQTGKLVVAP